MTLSSWCLLLAGLGIGGLVVWIVMSCRIATGFGEEACEGTVECNGPCPMCYEANLRAERAEQAVQEIVMHEAEDAARQIAETEARRTKENFSAFCRDLAQRSEATMTPEQQERSWQMIRAHTRPFAPQKSEIVS